ncbi:hypothetical protein F5B22DRAFT_643956 [Xylaria bambusicola]|uniref:uncharacterized protein n=1 Tax=Xylaria bambusicola TaxID=326684 RepID=UPI002008B592|nr:uncharacterized protein F5B22DRAFT_643956 [Xylaria bambusicola]KAI0521229.1 hypothetical protein F5B22DRAFT_643956 [Xylaria bambusicola]
MSQATGRIVCTDGGHKITAIFMIDGVQRQFIGQLNGATREFTSMNATIQYGDLNQLLGQHTFNGLLGPVHITLHFENSTTISGSLDVPVEPVSQIVGTGNWVVTM